MKIAHPSSILPFYLKPLKYLKMKKFTLFVGMIAAMASSMAQNVNIPDANFKAALIGNGIDINVDGEIQYDEASAYAGSISVNSQSIADLTGIEAFTNITSLDCSSNSLEGLDVS